MNSTKKTLVSIITPCYNAGNCVHRLFKSIIEQTYRPIEFILINDGSTDNTSLIIEEYRPKFKAAGITFLCINQENQGLSGAINSGLKLFSGEYLCWPDADDYLEPTSVEEKLNAFLENPNVAVVTSDAFLRSSENLGKTTGRIATFYPHSNEEKQFEYLLKSESIFCPGCHMLKRSALLEVNPDLTIYNCRRGQNFQLLLPLYFRYKRFFLNKPLYNYVDYPNSMSKNRDSFESYFQRVNEHEDIILNVLRKIQNLEKEDMDEYINTIKQKYARKKMIVAINFRKKTEFQRIYNLKKDELGIDIYDIVLKWRLKFPLLNSLWIIVKSTLVL